MSSTQQALLFVLQTLFQLYITIVLVRFLLQLAKADFYNPVSQAVVKLTSPVLQPLRRIIPGFAGLDIASLVLAVGLSFIMLMLSSLIAYGVVVNPLALFIGSIAGVVQSITTIYFFAIIISAISSWIPAIQRHPVTLLVWQIVEPIQAPFRKILPDMGGIDISPLFALLALKVVQILIAPFVLF